MRIELRVIAALWCSVSLVALAIALPRMSSPGLYYDEAFMAQQARDFAEPSRLGSHPPSTQQVRLFGRSYPLRNAAYLGSLKSQLTIPALMVFGSSPRVLRATTMVFGLLGLLLCMLWAERCFGLATALFGGVLIVSDPSFWFFSQYEWGPFTTGLLCRGGGFWLLVVGWSSRKLWLTAAAGVVLGLGVYSRVDFAVILASAGIALFVAQPSVLAEALGAGRRHLAALAVGFIAASATTLVSILEIASASAGIADRGDLAYRTDVLWSVLDGSHFARLMQVGGRFDVMFQDRAGAGIFAYVVIVAAIVLLALLARDMLWKRTSVDSSAHPPTLSPASRGRLFLLVTSAVLTAAMLSISGAVRAHHMLNLMPFVHFAIATVLAIAWQPAESAPERNARPTAFARGGTLGLVAIIVAFNFATIAETDRFIQETGGTGRWSDALQKFGAEADQSRETTVVSLDWGFHEPLQFTSQRAMFFEPIWQIGSQLRRGQPWTHDGDEHHIYLVHLPPYDLFGLSDAFLEAARAVRSAKVEETIHRDRSGEGVFASIRFDRAHRIAYTGKFAIRF